MKPLRLLAPLAALATAAFAAAFDTTAWEFQQPVTLDRAGPVRLTLPAETLDAARADLADLRLLGPDGAEIPFAIVRRNTSRPATERIPTQARLEERTTVLELGLAQERVLQRLRLETPAAEFVKSASVEIERPDGRWERAADSVFVFRIRNGLEQVALELGGARGRTLRLTLQDDRSAPIPITAVVVETGGTEPEQFIEVPVGISAAEQEVASTRLSLDLGRRHRPLAALVLEAQEPVFQRGARLIVSRAVEDEIVEDTLGTGTFARLLFPGDRRYEQLALPVDAVAPSARLDLVLDNGDSPPLTGLRLTARLRRIDVGFAAPAAGIYTLLAGAPQATAPRYDVAAFAADWGRLPSLDAAVGPRTANPRHRPTQVPVDIPEFGGPIDPTKWSQRREVILVAPGAQVLELDAVALARSRSDFADLRLVRGDRQVPYVLERTSRQRSTPLSLVPAPDAKRPSVGRWELALPVEGLPATSLRLVVDEPVFARNVIVGELLPDSRGQPWPRVLGSAAIQRRQADDPAAFLIPLNTRPQSGRLYVEIDHGDNAAFTPVKIDALHPVRRLRFRSTDTAGCVLLYGHAAAAAPRYDLQLAAPRLLAAPAHPATLAAVEAAGASHSTFSLGGPAGRLAFWGGLVVAVGVLVWLVAKLLPKPPAA